MKTLLGNFKYSGVPLHFDTERIRRTGNMVFVGSHYRANAFLSFLNDIKKGEAQIHLHCLLEKSPFSWLQETPAFCCASRTLEELQDALPETPRTMYFPTSPTDTDERITTPYILVMDDLVVVHNNRLFNKVVGGLHASILMRCNNFVLLGVVSPLEMTFFDTDRYNTFFFAPFEEDSFLCHFVKFGAILPSMLADNELLVYINGQWDVLIVDSRWLPS